jgi:hypothetical protein
MNEACLRPRNGLFLVSCLIACLSFMAPRDLLADTPAERLAIPSPAKQSEAEQRIRSVFKTEYSDRSLHGRQLLARRLLKEASTTNDPDSKFLLLRESRDKAAEAGDLSLALTAIDVMDDAYAIDGLAMRADALAKAGPLANTQGGHEEVVRDCLEVMEDAVALDRYEAAVRLTALADSAAARTKSMALVNEVDARIKEVRILSAEYNRSKSAMAKLKADPADPAANLAVGRYLSLFKGNWDDGLPLLAKSSDVALRNLARQDMESPTESAKEFALGNAWWDIAEKSSDLIKSRMRERASYWYRQAHPGLAGLDKTQAEKRLTEAGINVANLAMAAPAVIPQAAKLESGLVAEIYGDMQFHKLVLTRIDPQIDFEWGRGGPDTRVGGGKYGIRWTGVLMVPKGSVTSIGAEVDDGVHIFIDDTALLRIERPGRQFRPLRLSAGPHAIRIEYWNKLAGGRMKLFWTLGSSPGEQQPVPADAFFHSPALAAKSTP